MPISVLNQFGHGNRVAVPSKVICSMAADPSTTDKARAAAFTLKCPRIWDHRRNWKRTCPFAKRSG